MKQRPKRSKWKPIIFTRTVSYFRRTVHEEWVRNRIPRGAHYDRADDGPEVEIIEAIEKTDLAERLERWLHPHTWPAEGPVDALTHRRE